MRIASVSENSFSDRQTEAELTSFLLMLSLKKGNNYVFFTLCKDTYWKDKLDECNFSL